MDATVTTADLAALFGMTTRTLAISRPGAGGEAAITSATAERAQVEAEWSGVLRAGMLAVPSRAAQRLPHLSAHDVSVIDGEVRAVLTEIGSEGSGRASSV